MKIFGATKPRNIKNFVTALNKVLNGVTEAPGSTNTMEQSNEKKLVISVITIAMLNYIM